MAKFHKHIWAWFIFHNSKWEWQKLSPEGTVGVLEDCIEAGNTTSKVCDALEKMCLKAAINRKHAELRLALWFCGIRFLPPMPASHRSTNSSLDPAHWERTIIHCKCIGKGEEDGATARGPPRRRSRRSSGLQLRSGPALAGKNQSMDNYSLCFFHFLFNIMF